MLINVLYVAWKKRRNMSCTLHKSKPYRAQMLINVLYVAWKKRRNMSCIVHKSKPYRAQMLINVLYVNQWNFVNKYWYLSLWRVIPRVITTMFMVINERNSITWY